MNRPDLLLSRDDLDVMENNPMFTLWAFGKEGILDETELTEGDITVIKARQMYYDLILPDEYLCRVMTQAGCQNISEALADKQIIAFAARRLGVRQEIVTIKLRLLQMRVEREQEKIEKDGPNLNLRNGNML